MSLTDMLPVMEQFVSIQGEGRNLGVPYYFIRVGGCPLRCNFCDTEHSWPMDGHTEWSVEALVQETVEQCKTRGIQWVSITGGEPLLYPKQLKTLLIELNEFDINTHVETSGRFYDAACHSHADLWSMDAKTPCTGEDKEAGLRYLDKMTEDDQVKCLISSFADLDYAWDVRDRLPDDVPLILQPFNEAIATNSTSNMTPEMAEHRLRSPSKDDLLAHSARSLQWLIVETVMRSPKVWPNTIITPQIHVWAFGNEPGT